LLSFISEDRAAANLTTDFSQLTIPGIEPLSDDERENVEEELTDLVFNTEETLPKDTGKTQKQLFIHL